MDMNIMKTTKAVSKWHLNTLLVIRRLSNCMVAFLDKEC